MFTVTVHAWFRVERRGLEKQWHWQARKDWRKEVADPCCTSYISYERIRNRVRLKSRSENEDTGDTGELVF